ncbi:MAG: serine/threonine protein kinase [Planctomycetes bacterium]|nr:serine/threonine protein kinase [Planctomycetota bacterium]
MDKNREDLLDKIVAEYADKCAREGSPSREEYYLRYPELRDELEPCFRMIEAGVSKSPAAAARLSQGIRLGDYTIIREIGRGGMGVVYLAEQESLKRRVALKVLRHHLTLEPRHVSRFQREARAAARLRHPNIVSIFAVGDDDGHQFIAMDYIPGPTLAAVIDALKKLERRPTAADLAKITNNKNLEGCATYPEAAARLMLPVYDAVQAAHDAGIVHRDLKPSNIILDGNGSPSVADFGLAKGEGDIGLSFSGEPIGTPFYMAPEQVRASVKTTDARTDIYSLGVTLYELLTLERPFQADSYPDLVQRILTFPARSPRSVDKHISKNLERVVMQAMNKNIDARYPSTREFSQDLVRAIGGGPVLAKRARWTVCPRGGRFIVGIGVVGSRRDGGYIYGYPGYEYKSERKVFGIPLLHIANGMNPETGRPYVAKGIVAIGNTAVGVLAIGGAAFGGIAIGGMSFGVLAALGGIAIGTGISLGGVAVGSLAVGGLAVGIYSLGGAAFGLRTVSAVTQDPKALELFKSIFGDWVEKFRNNNR